MVNFRVVSKYINGNTSHFVIKSYYVSPLRAAPDGYEIMMSPIGISGMT
jgi:hypothetical protein